MRVRDVMSRETSSCGPDASLAAAAECMWRNGVGFLPVVGEGGNVIGVITDRDISIALGTGRRKPSAWPVQDVMVPKLFTCTPEEDVHCALKTLGCQRIRRLPVIDREGTLLGVFSIDDVALKAQEPASKNGVDRTFGNFAPPVEAELWAPPLEVKHKGGNFIVTAELPGLTKEEVKVEVMDESLVIEGEKRFKEEKGEEFFRSERYYGKFYRSIPLPKGAKAELIKAELTIGILEVVSPVPEVKPNLRHVPILAK